MESDEVKGGAAETPNPQTSPESAAASAVDLESLKKALEPYISQEVERRTQSVKDKRFAELTGKVDGFEAQLAKYQELRSEGLSEKLALRFMAMEPAAPSASPGKGQGDPGITEEHLEYLGLDPASPEVIALQRSSATLNEYIALGMQKRKAVKAAPNPAAVLPTGSGGDAGSDLMADYQREISRSGLTRNQKLEIRSRYRKKGLPI